MKKKLTLKPEFRSAELNVADDENRIVEFSGSSELPVDRFDYDTGERYKEILDHTPENCDLSRMNGGPLLDCHYGDQVGVIDTVELKDKRTIVRARFSRASQRANELWQDIKDGIRRGISVGYTKTKILSVEKSEEGKTIRFAWQPFEFSLVTVPADPTVGIGREADFQKSTLDFDEEPNQETITTTERNFSMPEATEKKSGLTAEQLRDVFATAAKYNCVDQIETMIRDGKTSDECYHFILTQRANATPVKTAELGLSTKEKQRFSFARAMLALNDKDWSLAPFEKEVSDATAKAMHQSARGFCVPTDVLEFRDGSASASASASAAFAGQVAGTTTAGGNLVATDLLGGSFIDLLKKHLVLNKLGMTTLSGLIGNIAIPRATGGLNYYWVGENGDATGSAATFDQVAFTPKTVAGKAMISRQLLMQSSISIEVYIRKLIAEAVAEGLESAALVGTGSNYQPRGLFNISGLNTVAIDTNGGACTGDHIVNMETEIADDDVIDDGTIAYLTNARVRGKLKRTQEFSSTNGVPLWKTTAGDRGIGDLNGYPAYVSAFVPKDGTKGTGTNLSAMLLGKWSDAILALWGGLDIIADPYSNSDNGSTKFIAFQSADFNVKHPESFCKITDIKLS